MAKVKKSAAAKAKTKTANKAASVEFKSTEFKSSERKSSSGNGPVEHDGVIEPAKGKLGVMIPGMGAVATTFVAGVEAVRKGISSPIGSLTQMGTIRLGKRTDGRSPKIKDFVPLAGLNDLVFGTWDIFEENGYEAAKHAGVLEPAMLEKVKEPLEKIRPMKAVFDPEYVKRITGPNLKPKGSKMDHAEMLMDDIKNFKESSGASRL